MEIRSKKRNRPRALALVVVLWVLVVLAVLAVTLARNTKLENAVRVAGGDRVTARWLARAGIFQAISEIAGDISSVDSTNDVWYDDELFRKSELDGGWFTVYADRFLTDNRSAYGVTDEAAKVNLNTASREILLALPEMTESLAEAIIDLRQRRAVKPIEEDGSTELQKQMLNLLIDKGAIPTARTLRLLSEVTEQLLYGEDSNLNGVLEENENDGDDSPPIDDKDGLLDRGLLAYVTVYSYELNRDGQKRKRININSAELEKLESELELLPAQSCWIVKNRPYNCISDLLAEDTSEESSSASTLIEEMAAEGAAQEEICIRPDRAIFRRIADRITVIDDEIVPGRININTAENVVLNVLPGIDEQLVQRIIQFRESQPYGFSSIAEILAVPGIKLKIFKQIAPLITVRSNVFTIRSCGQAELTGIRHTIEAVVARGLDEPTVLYWKETR